MSGSNLNNPEMHDTGLYDGTRHDNHIVAVYETDERARGARDLLTQSGVPADHIQLVDREYGEDRMLSGQKATGFWGALQSLFFPSDEMNAYGHAVHRGHAMLIVTPDGTTDRHQIIHVLEGTEPLDFDAKLEEWRQSGYDYADAPVPGTMEGGAPATTPSSTGAVGAAAGMAPTGVPGLADFDSETGTTVPPVGGPAPNAAPAAIPPSDTGSTDTGYRDATVRTSQREQPPGANRVRSYLVDRPLPPNMDPSDTTSIEAQATAPESVVPASDPVARPSSTLPR